MLPENPVQEKQPILKDSLAAGLAKGIISGDGDKCPIGLDRDIHEGVSVSGNKYPRKSKVKIKSFMPKEYGEVLAKMAKTEKGRMRKFDKVSLVCNMTDYLTKIMPATTALNAIGGFTNNLFPFPTETVVENSLADGEAIVFLPKEYFLGVSQGKEGAITYSDEFKFLDDKRVYKIKMFAMGKAYDDRILCYENKGWNYYNRRGFRYVEKESTGTIIRYERRCKDDNC